MRTLILLVILVVAIAAAPFANAGWHPTDKISWKEIGKVQKTVVKVSYHKAKHQGKSALGKAYNGVKETGADVKAVANNLLIRVGLKEEPPPPPKPFWRFWNLK